MQKVLRTALITASNSKTLERQVTSRQPTRALALRYVAGETLDQGLMVTRASAVNGKAVTLDYLGESVTAEAEARKAAEVYIDACQQLAAEELAAGAGISVKPTQMGLSFDPELCRKLLGQVAAAAGAASLHLTLDMEGSDVTEATVRLVETLHAEGHHHTGCAVQSYLHRTEADVARLSQLDGGGASLRLCKGAYAEPDSVAYQRRREVDAAYARQADYLLQHGTYPRFATHDDALIDHIRNSAARWQVPRQDFEFQMLHGVRSSLQDALVRDGYRVTVYVPFGSQWYPYFMRRLAERPKNVIFFLRSLRDR